MTQEKLIDAITELDSDILERYFAVKADLAEKKKPKRNALVKWGSLAACFCLVFVGVLMSLLFIDKQFEIPQTVHYNNAEYIVCGSKGEASILEKMNLPTVLSKELAGEQIAYLRVDDNAFLITQKTTKFVLYEYAPSPNENVYIVLIDGEYYAAIRHDANGYHGIKE